MFIKPLYFFEYFILFIFINIFINLFIEWINDDLIFTESSILLTLFIILFILKYFYQDDVGYDEDCLGYDDNDGADFDFFINFYRLIIDDLWFFYSLIITEFKKWKLFTFKFKYFIRMKTNKLFFSKYTKNRFLIWRPIFKKWSYLGYYRSNRSKWLK